MRWRVGWGLVAVVALALGVSNAAGRIAAVTTITVQVVGNGKVTSDAGGIKCGSGNTKCYVSFTGSGTVDLTADPANDWSFDDWGGTGDTDCVSTTGTCTITKDDLDHQVTANFSKTSGSPTKTLSVSAPLDGSSKGGNVIGGEIHCGSDLPASGTCNWTVPKDSVLTVHETPDTSYVFNGWSGDCEGTNITCTVVMSEDRDVGATWNPATVEHQLTVTVSGQGAVTGGGIDCDGPGVCTKDEPSGATIVLKAKPADGFVLSGWSGSCTGVSDTCTVTMDSARSVTATFAVAPMKLDVTVNGNGNVSGGSGAINCGNGANICSGSFVQNATVTLVATPATGATFAGWTGACGGTSTTCTILLNQAKSVTATFTGGTAGTGFALSVSVSGSGSVTGGGISCGNGATLCSVNQTPNTTVVLTATPSAGASFLGWGGACSGTATTCSVVMTAARSVTASFTGGTGGGGTTVQLTVSVTGSGIVTGGGISCGNGNSTCTANVGSGSTVTLIATPTAGATFSGWGGSCNGASPTCTLTLTSSRSVTATFTAAAPGTLTITVNGRGTVSTRGGRCIGAGATKTCVQRLTGRSVTLTEIPAAGQAFGGWGGACASAGRRATCTLTLAAARAVTATFNAASGGGGGGGGAAAVLTSRGLPLVRHTATGFRVTLRFNTTQGGLARVRGLRAGRVGVALSLRVAAGPATIGPFQVARSGFYTFEVTLGGRSLRWRTCLGRCGRFAPGPNFVLTRGRPTVTRSGDVWSVTLHLRANLISAARVQAFRRTRKLVDQRFLARAGEIAVGPFLLGPGSYTLRLTATDAYGRTRTLSWIVSLAG
jgi:uncharacterized repeat protein (TIGR02543 family)